MKLYNGARVTVRVKGFFKDRERVGVIVSNILFPFTIAEKETDMPMKSDFFLVWTFFDGEVRSYHRDDIDTNTTKLRVFDA